MEVPQVRGRVGTLGMEDFRGCKRVKHETRRMVIGQQKNDQEHSF